VVSWTTAAAAVWFPEGAVAEDAVAEDAVAEDAVAEDAVAERAVAEDAVAATVAAPTSSLARVPGRLAGRLRGDGRHRA